MADNFIFFSRYNLKRRVASLPPISSEVFNEKVLQTRAATTAQADKARFERTCDTCQKTYSSENAYRNHIGSAKHRAKLAQAPAQPNGKVIDDASSVMSSTFSLGEPANTKSEVDSDAEEEFQEVIEGLKQTGLQDRTSPVKRPANPPPDAAEPVAEEAADGTTETKDDSALKTCLFCNYQSPTAQLNALHMERIHGMFIPEKQYLVDLEGLLGHLRERVFELHECLTCGKMKASTFAVQTHMRDKSHCQIPYTTEDEQLEIGDFYDFRSSYSDDEEEWEDEDEDDVTEDGKQNGRAKLGAKRDTKVTNEDGDEEMADEDGWETDSSASSLDSDDLHAVPAENHYHQYERLGKHPHHSRDDPRAHKQADGWHAHTRKPTHAAYYDEYELHLPSGRSVGHRSLNRYFRQNLHNHPLPEERAERLAIEAAQRESGMEIDGQQVAPRRNADGTHGRAIINRETRGLLGIRDANEKDVKKAIRKGRRAEFDGKRRERFQENKMHFKEYHRNHATMAFI